LTGGRCSEVTLGLKVVGWDLEWSLLTGGRCSEMVANTGLTVFGIFISFLYKVANLQSAKFFWMYGSLAKMSKKTVAASIYFFNPLTNTFYIFLLIR